MWIPVEQALPLLGMMVHVKGDYVAPDTGHPRSYLRPHPFNREIRWEGNEWRGTVAIREWWLDDEPTAETTATTT